MDTYPTTHSHNFFMPPSPILSAVLAASLILASSHTITADLSSQLPVSIRQKAVACTANSTCMLFHLTSIPDLILCFYISNETLYRH